MCPATRTRARPWRGAKPFFVNPTRCDVPKKSVLEARSWSTPAMASSEDDANGDGNKFDRAEFTPTGCDQVPFGAFMKLGSETTRAGSPSGQTVTIQYPRGAGCPALPAAPDCTYELDEIWQSQLRHADVTLPEGMSLSPGGGVGLEACSAAQFGVDRRRTGRTTSRSSARRARTSATST